MKSSKRSLMSVVLVTPDSYLTIRKTMSHLQAQTFRDSLEIILVAPSREQLDLDESQMDVFARFDIVELGSIQSIGQANAAGIRRATAAVVALAEDHCFPDADWAEHLIKAHDGPWAAVGPCVRNANPATAISWADLFIGYGPWLSSASGREIEFLPGHNSSYKRDVLLSYGDRLEQMMDAETVLHWDLRAKGHHLYFEPTARVAHTNFSLWSSWVPIQYHNGRLFAGSRNQEMKWWQRVIYIAGSPLIPWVRLARLVALQLSGRLLGRFVWCLPSLIVGLSLDGLGQMVGYTMGYGNALKRVAEYEFHRIRHVTKQDRMVFEIVPE